MGAWPKVADIETEESGMRFDRSLWIHVVVLLGVAMLAASAHAEPSAERQQVLINMVRQDCGSCHGMTFKGGLGPSLLPEDMKTKSVASLVATVMNGRPGTAMPGWSPFMTEQEAEWIVEHLQQGFPPVVIKRELSQ